MSWRNQGITGSNNIPLGSRRRFRDEDSQTPPRDDGGYNPSQQSTGIAEAGYKRGRSPVKCKFYKPAYPLLSCIVSDLTFIKPSPPQMGLGDARREIVGVMLRKTRPPASWAFPR
jgi:hypothetical protein